MRAKNENANVGEKFLEMLEKEMRKIWERFKIPKKMIFLEKEKEKFENENVCWICKEKFQEEKAKQKVRDHCHFSGKYRGAAHRSCNLNFRKPKFTPIFFHNLSGYDSHLFVKDLGKKNGNLKCIPNNEEKYISFSKMIYQESYETKKGKNQDVFHEFRFLDSFKFMASSLDALSKNLSPEKLKQTKKVFGDKWKLVSKKGFYPYDWMDSFEKFKENSLPPKYEFFSILNGEGISEENFQHAKNVWEEFECKNMGDFHDVYLKTDVVLLADVFEEFRNVCLENYELDPAWYYTSPGLAWDAALKETKVELDLLNDPEMLLFFERGIRGGISTICHRLGNANNKYMKNFDSEKPSKFIPYLDANNLYGWAMVKPLPVGDFAWMSENDLKEWKNIPCVLEVDLEIPKNLHDYFNDYPPAPELLKLKNSQVEKLISNLWDKEKYVLHCGLEN